MSSCACKVSQIINSVGFVVLNQSRRAHLHVHREDSVAVPENFSVVAPRAVYTYVRAINAPGDSGEFSDLVKSLHYCAEFRSFGKVHYFSEKVP